MKAYVKKDTANKNPNALWIIVERGEDKADISGIMGMFRKQDDANNIAYPVLEDELVAIRDAINKFLDVPTKTVKVSS